MIIHIVISIALSIVVTLGLLTWVEIHTAGPHTQIFEILIKTVGVIKSSKSAQHYNGNNSVGYVIYDRSSYIN